MVSRNKVYKGKLDNVDLGALFTHVQGVTLDGAGKAYAVVQKHTHKDEDYLCTWLVPPVQAPKTSRWTGPYPKEQAQRLLGAPSYTTSSGFVYNLPVSGLEVVVLCRAEASPYTTGLIAGTQIYLQCLSLVLWHCYTMLKTRMSIVTFRRKYVCLQSPGSLHVPKGTVTTLVKLKQRLATSGSIGSVFDHVQDVCPFMITYSPNLDTEACNVRGSM